MASKKDIFTCVVQIGILTLIFSICTLGYAEDIKPAPTRMMFKDGELVPAPPQKPRVIPTTSPLEEEANRIFIEQEMASEEGRNWPPPYFMPPQPEDTSRPIFFELPKNQQIYGCTYAAGYSFPDNCSDEDGNLLFRAGEHPQSKLDEIKAAQGIKGEYNIVPEGYHSKPLDDDAEDVAAGRLPPVSEMPLESLEDAPSGHE